MAPSHANRLGILLEQGDAAGVHRASITSEDITTPAATKRVSLVN